MDSTLSASRFTVWVGDEALSLLALPEGLLFPGITQINSVGLN